MDQILESMSYRGLDRRRSARDAMHLVVVIDAELSIKYCSTDGVDATEVKAVLTDDRRRLRPELEVIAGRLVTVATTQSVEESRVAILDADRVVRLSRLVGGDGTLFALIFGTNHNRDSLMRASVRYTLTKRQCDVLALILEGDSVAEMAEALCITENTVQGYVKTLLSKTQSRNRPAMVAKVLDWNQARPGVPSFEREPMRRDRTA